MGFVPKIRVRVAGGCGTSLPGVCPCPIILASLEKSPLALCRCCSEPFFLVSGDLRPTGPSFEVLLCQAADVQDHFNVDVILLAEGVQEHPQCARSVLFQGFARRPGSVCRNWDSSAIFCSWVFERRLSSHTLKRHAMSSFSFQKGSRFVGRCSWNPASFCPSQSSANLPNLCLTFDICEVVLVSRRETGKNLEELNWVL